MHSAIVYDTNSVPGTEHQLPIAFPPRRARIVIVIVRALVFALLLLAPMVFASPGRFSVGSTRIYLETHGTLAEVLIAAGIAWFAVWMIILLDGRRVRADRDGVHIRLAFRTRFLPWPTITAIASTDAGLAFATTGGTVEKFTLLTRSSLARSTMPVSPMVALATQLEEVRVALRTGSYSNLSQLPTTRVLALTMSEWVQIVAMFLLLAGLTLLLVSF